jgi:hypothetical protein
METQDVGIQLYDLFRKDLKLPEERAHEAVQIINGTVREQALDKFEHTAELIRKDFQSMKLSVDKDIQSMKLSVDKDIQSLREHMDMRFTVLDNKFATKEEAKQLEVKIESTKAEIIRWMFVFWIGQIAVTVGIVVLFLKK